MTVSQPASPRAGATSYALPARHAKADVPSHGRPIGRIPITGVGPLVDGGSFPVKSVVGERFDITATVFREGHDAVAATVALTDPSGTVHRLPMTCVNAGLDRWACTVGADRTGGWTYAIEAWSDPWTTWVHDATIKIGAGVDVELMLEEGARLLERAASDAGHDREGRETLTRAAAVMRDTRRDVEHRLTAATGSPVADLMRDTPLRDFVTSSPTYDWLVERETALSGAWYELFPRSEGAHLDERTGKWVSGTLRTAARRLDAVAAMGFDVVYLTPVHPIGHTNRKGPNNTLVAGPDDPGSPYAIGNSDGGHDAIHPELGTFDDFDAFVERAHELGLQVALDLALQCSPDHPWVTSHPEWFTTRADGSIAYAENPPKKYQDIYPVNFDNDPKGIYAEVRRVVQVWIDHGVRIFRVDNPHTKPVEFWQWLIGDVSRDHPDVVWLAEAFTRPAMMHMLAKVGFQQSYTYFAWRNSAEELREYLEELSGESAAYMRPSLWPTTHDILTPYMQYGGPTAWKLRAALAATASPTYGIYAGYELIEHVARPGAEEQLDNEKYQFRDRRWQDYAPGGPKEGRSLAPFLTLLNRIRSEHPCLHRLRNITFHDVDDHEMLVFSKRRGDDCIVVVANCDPHSTRESTVHLDLPSLGLRPGEDFVAHDLVTDTNWHWGEHNYVRLGVDNEPVHIVHVRRP